MLPLSKRQIGSVGKSRRSDGTVLSSSVARIHFSSGKKVWDTLAEDVGIEGDLVRNATGQAYVLVNGELHPIPGGSVMGVPTEIGPFLKTGLFSVAGKLRAAGDFVLPRSPFKAINRWGTFSDAVSAGKSSRT